MSITDKLILKYFTLATPLSGAELKEIEKKLKDPSVNPRNLKVRLAFELVKKYYDENTARSAEQEFENIFVKKELPDDMPEFRINAKGRKLVEIMKETGLAASISEANRLIKQGGVSVNGNKITDEKEVLSDKELILKVGKRKFAKILPA
jgi:tyrosyl-tRNA synthetase